MLDIGIAVHSLLTEDAAITAIVGENVYPLGVPNAKPDGSNIKYPLIIYGRSSILPIYAKDMPRKDTVNVTVDVWSDSYKQAIELAKLITTTLEAKRGTFAGVRIQDSSLLSANESFDLPNYYGQILIFEFR